MEKKELIKTEEKRLSDLNLKVIELDVENGYADFDFLEEDLKESLREKLKENKIKIVGDFKIFYSLSYCQGDGFSFIGDFEYKNYSVQIRKGRLSNLYCHPNTTNIFMETEKGNEPKEEIQDRFKELYDKICKEMEDIGYSIIEETEKNNILRAGFEEWKEINNLTFEGELFEVDYKENGEEGYIKICDSGNTTIKGLWLKDIKVKVSDYLIAKAEIKKHREKTLIS